MSAQNTDKDQGFQEVVQDAKFRWLFRWLVLLATTAWGFF